jgi:hypothetical protein
VLERENNTDLIMCCGPNDYHHFELKNWRGAGGDAYLRGMQKDVETKLRNRRNGYLLVTSINPPAVTEQNFVYLESRVGSLDVHRRHCHRFLTKPLKGGEALEFWIAGWPLLRSSSAET